MHAFTISLLAFLTVVDLFATQAILPPLAKAYQVDAAIIGPAVNAGTLGMAIAGLGVAFWGRAFDPRRTTAIALALLSVPTLFLAWAPDVVSFAMLRVVQGLLMATAFSLTLASIARSTRGPTTAKLFAAYITGNVASNLFGRLMSASLADMFGLSANFVVFAALNLAGAALAYATLSTPADEHRTLPAMSKDGVARLLADEQLRAAFALGFCILFAFIGVFTYVNFVLVQPPLSLGMMSVGLSYFVFLPSIITTPLAGRLVARFGTRGALWIALAIAIGGLPMLLAPSLPSVLAAMTLVAVGTFQAQAIATGFVGRAAAENATTASGIYLTCYFLGGLIGSVVLGQLFSRFGWPSCVAGVGVSLVAAATCSWWLLDADAGANQADIAVSPAGAPQIDGRKV